MKAQELRIGNWVYQQSSKMVKEEVYTTPCKIQTINSQTGFKYQPIPLTEEILLNCGFIPCSIIDDEFSLNGMTILKDWGVFTCKKTEVEIEYVHQLQNIFYILTNQELEIKL